MWHIYRLAPHQQIETRPNARTHPHAATQLPRAAAQTPRSRIAVDTARETDTRPMNNRPRSGPLFRRASLASVAHGERTTRRGKLHVHARRMRGTARPNTVLSEPCRRVSQNKCAALSSDTDHEHVYVLPFQWTGEFFDTGRRGSGSGVSRLWKRGILDYQRTCIVLFAG